MPIDIDATLYATGTAPKVIVLANGIPDKVEKASLYQAGDGAPVLVGEARVSAGAVVFVDDFPDLSNRGKYLLRVPGEPVVEWDRTQWWPAPDGYGWLRDAHDPYSPDGLRFLPRGDRLDPAAANFLTVDTASELGFETGGETLQVLGARYPVLLGGQTRPGKFKASLLLVNEKEIGKARRLIDAARVLCLQLPPTVGFLPDRTVFTPVTAALTRVNDTKALLELEVTPVARPRAVYQPDRLISALGVNRVTWGQAQANAEGYGLLALKASPTILLGARPAPLYDTEAMMKWWAENAIE